MEWLPLSGIQKTLMSFLKKVFGSKDDIQVVDAQSFWQWFRANEKSFYQSIKKSDEVDTKFLKKLMPKLQQLNNQFYCLTGMLDDEIAELVITAEGDIKSFVFVEDLVAAAPSLKRWKFTALKPPIGLDGISIEMDGMEFNSSNISFISNIDENYADEIDITLVYDDFTEEKREIISNGLLIYLDNALGELNAATLIDNISVSGPPKDRTDLISIDKLANYLVWREKEFVEKYKATRYHTENDNYSALEGKDESDLPVIAIVNQELLDWDAKASHPWLMLVEIKYDGKENGGMPQDGIYRLMDVFEDEMLQSMSDADGYLNVGRQTYNGRRTIYFACKEFRHPSRTAASLIQKYGDKLEIAYDIFKDKYWRVLNRFTS